MKDIYWKKVSIANLKFLSLDQEPQKWEYNYCVPQHEYYIIYRILVHIYLYFYFIFQKSTSNETKYSEWLRKEEDSSKLCQGTSVSVYGDCERYFNPAGEEREDQESEKWHDDSSNLLHLVLSKNHC